MIGIGINESGDWIEIKGLVISVEQIFYVASIIATYYIAKREQKIKNNFKRKVDKLKTLLEESE